VLEQELPLVEKTHGTEELGLQDYHKLRVWRAAHEVALAVYGVTGSFPRSEIYGIVSQMRRAAVSVAANIVEGSSRKSDGDFRRFLCISQASAAEVDYLVELSQDLGMLSKERGGYLRSDLCSVRRQLSALISSL